jgi:hypothetical protein
MQQQRPTGAVVIAVLHIIGGTLLLLSSLCTGAAQLAGGQKAFMPSAGTAQSKQQQDLTERMEKHLADKAPGYQAIQYGQIGLSFVIAIILLAAGIGLLKMQSWARLLSILYAIVSILNHLFTIVYSFVFTIPALQEFVQAEKARDPANAFMYSAMESGGMIGVLVASVFILYPILVLIVMLWPGMGEAFRNFGAARELPEEFDDDRGFGGYRGRSDEGEADPRFRGEDR